MEVHLVPTGENHDLSEDCECKPRRQIVDGFVRIVHNAYDRRDKLEAFGKPSKGWEIWGTKLLKTK